MVGKNKPAMVEFHTVKRIDNTRLVRHVEPVKMRNLYKTAALGAVVAVCCMLYIYQHFRCIDLSFQLEDLRVKQEQSLALNGALKLEIATLRDPQPHRLAGPPSTGIDRTHPDASARVHGFRRLGSGCRALCAAEPRALIACANMAAAALVRVAKHLWNLPRARAHIRSHAAG